MTNNCAPSPWEIKCDQPSPDPRHTHPLHPSPHLPTLPRGAVLRRITLSSQVTTILTRSLSFFVHFLFYYVVCILKNCTWFFIYLFIFIFLFFLLFRATPAAYGNFQARGPIKVPQLPAYTTATETPDPYPTEWGQGLNPQPHGS